jgi:hypothetical protein
METVPFNGWKHNVRLANREVELIVTQEVGPRVIRFGFIGSQNLFAEYEEQQGRSGEGEWMIRGGHRLWVAPEVKPDTYELDNSPVEIRRSGDGILTVQPPGSITKIQKTMKIALDARRNRVQIVHALANRGRRKVTVAPWALTVMAPGGTAIIPLPAKGSHAKTLTHNQEWSIWPYTDLADGRWTFGSKYVFFRQDRKRGPGKLGVAHREGWVAYQLDRDVFVKHFTWKEGAAYPDGGVNFETFSNPDMLEVESLGPLVALQPGASVQHVETWDLFRDVPRIRNDADADRLLRPLIR